MKFTLIHIGDNKFTYTKKERGETTLYDTIIVYTCHYTFVQCQIITQCQLQTLGDNNGMM